MHGFARRDSVEGLARDTACRVAGQIGESAHPPSTSVRKESFTGDVVGFPIGIPGTCLGDNLSVRSFRTGYEALPIEHPGDDSYGNNKGDRVRFGWDRRVSWSWASEALPQAADRPRPSGTTLPSLFRLLQHQPDRRVADPGKGDPQVGDHQELWRMLQHRLTRFGGQPRKPLMAAGESTCSAAMKLAPRTPPLPFVWVVTIRRFCVARGSERR